jgi:predicted HTH domain antitoxin
MNTVEITIRVPMTLSEDEVRLSLAVKLFEEGKLSLGQAAELADFSLRAFIEILGRRRIPVFNYSAEDLRQERDCWFVGASQAGRCDPLA